MKQKMERKKKPREEFLIMNLRNLNLKLIANSFEIKFFFRAIEK